MPKLSKVLVSGTLLIVPLLVVVVVVALADGELNTTING